MDYLDYRSKVSSANAITGIPPGENKKELHPAAGWKRVPVYKNSAGSRT
jgi:hypothetical protein